MNVLGRTWRKRFDERGLRWLFAAFFLALAVPAAFGQRDQAILAVIDERPSGT